MRTSVKVSGTGTLDAAVPSAMGVVTRLACARAKHEGVEVETLLLKAGLTRHQVNDTVAPASKSKVRSSFSTLSRRL